MTYQEYVAETDRQRLAYGYVLPRAYHVDVEVPIRPRVTAARPALGRTTRRPASRPVRLTTPTPATRAQVAARLSRDAEDRALRERLLGHDARILRARNALPPGWAPARSA